MKTENERLEEIIREMDNMIIGEPVENNIMNILWNFLDWRTKQTKYHYEKMVKRIEKSAENLKSFL